MADILLYIKPEQVERVFRDGSVGSGQNSFQGMSREGGRVFVASRTGVGLAVVGEIPSTRPSQTLNTREDGSTESGLPISPFGLTPLRYRFERVTLGSSFFEDSQAQLPRYGGAED